MFAFLARFSAGFISAVIVCLPTDAFAIACIHRWIPIEGAQTFTITIFGDGGAAVALANRLRRKAEALIPKTFALDFQSDRYLSAVVTASPSEPLENQILIYLIRRGVWFGLSGVASDEPFYQSVESLLDAERKSGAISSFEANAKVDPQSPPLRIEIQGCIP